jgi:hypothetical protein
MVEEYARASARSTGLRQAAFFGRRDVPASDKEGKCGVQNVTLWHCFQY